MNIFVSLCIGMCKWCAFGIPFSTILIFSTGQYSSCCILCMYMRVRVSVCVCTKQIERTFVHNTAWTSFDNVTRNGMLSNGVVTDKVIYTLWQKDITVIRGQWKTGNVYERRYGSGVKRKGGTCKRYPVKISTHAESHIYRKCLVL